MSSHHNGKLRIEEKGTKYRLLTIEALIFLIPFLTISYIFYKNHIFLDLSQMILLAFTLIVILSGLIILRIIFERIFNMIFIIGSAVPEENNLTDIKKDTFELHRLSVSFQKLMEKLESTTKELKLRVFELFTIRELTETAGKNLDIDYLLHLLLGKAMSVTKAKIGSVLLLEKENKRFRVVAAKGLESSPKAGTYIDIEGSLTKYIVSDNNTLLVKDIETDSRTRKPNDHKYGPPSFLSMPLFIRDELIGIINLSHKNTEQIFDTNDEQILSIMIGEISFALENAKLYSELSEYSKNLQKRTEELTNVNNQLQKEIADRKLMEEEKEKLHTQLLHSQKMEAIGTLAGGVAHDLNNVLSGIVSYPDFLLKGIERDSPFRKPIIKIMKSGEKAAAIVHDLLTLTRRGIIVSEPIMLNQVISEYLNSPEHERLKEYHPKVQMETNLEQNLFHITGSPIHINKTIMNLVSNAVEAIPGEGKILISTSNRYIDKPVRCYDDKIMEGEFVVLEVADTGSGISPGDMSRIFEPFYTKKIMGRSGTGLGMAVVWGTIKDHKGFIDIESQEGKGTVFRFYFPATRTISKVEMQNTENQDYTGNGETILIVDDIEEQRDIASEILKILGYNVITVPSGEEAIEYFRKNTADMMILDMIMDPGIDGLETYEKIIEIHPGQKAIITSGFSETDRVKKVLQLGAGQYVKKPYTFQKIGLSVKNELNKRT